MRVNRAHGDAADTNLPRSAVPTEPNSTRRVRHTAKRDAAPTLLGLVFVLSLIWGVLVNDYRFALAVIVMALMAVWVTFR